ncbi:MAG: hypothetical protein J7M21_00250 [Planctomycetes bacterium]|nr:hypothetical protein [Planctomycetota bacterium]
MPGSETTDSTEQLYAQRLERYVTAMRNGKPDRVPIRPFVAEFTAKYAGYTCQDVTHDYRKAFDAVLRCAKDFDWDAIVPNMVYVWTGLTEALGLKYYGVPGIDVPADTGFQYREPPEERAFMPPEDYDRLIAGPVRYLYETWLPRVSKDVAAAGEPNTYRSSLALVKGAMAMMDYFTAFGPQVEALRRQAGTVSAIAGILKAPMDILADKLRGYLGLCTDLLERPGKVKAACEALAPHLLKVALSGADPDRNVPVAIWMHRGCVPFVSPKHFDEIYWPTLKPIIEALWAEGVQTLFYAEGKWAAHLDSFCELPAGSIVYHVDHDDIFEVHKKIGHKFAISGGIPNFLLAYRSRREVEDYCKKVIDSVAADGGYILDAGAIVQNDAKVENIRAMTDFTRQYGVYGTPQLDAAPPAAPPGDQQRSSGQHYELKDLPVPPGVCIQWAEKLRELPRVVGDAELLQRIWQDVDFLGYLFIWHCLLSF